MSPERRREVAAKGGRAKAAVSPPRPIKTPRGKPSPTRLVYCVGLRITLTEWRRLQSLSVAMGCNESAVWRAALANFGPETQP